MPTLAELQSAFARGLMGDTREAAAWVVAGDLDPAARLRIYANNTEAIQTQYLRSAFPAVERLGGADYFAGLAHAYRQACPSRSGDLTEMGAAFPEFLAQQLVGSPYALIADVARLEWAYQDVLCAPDAAVFDAAGLLAIPAERHDSLVFTLAPSVRRVASSYPIGMIWEANRNPGADVPTIALDGGGEVLLLHRIGTQAHCRRLDPAADAFVCALMRHAPLVEAVHALEQVDPDSDASQLLLDLIQSGRIDGFRSV